MTVKLFVALRLWVFTANTLVSVTTVVKMFVLGIWPMPGVQVITPLASMVAPLGPLN